MSQLPPIRHRPVADAAGDAERVVGAERTDEGEQRHQSDERHRLTGQRVAHFAKRERRILQFANNPVALAYRTVTRGAGLLTLPRSANPTLWRICDDHSNRIHQGRRTGGHARLCCLAHVRGRRRRTSRSVSRALRSADGDVRVALHRQMEDAKFPGDAGVVGAIMRPAASGTVRVIFADVAPGAYAVAVFHDADGDGELAQNFLGMPTEGYGFSNGAVGFMGPPSFADAVVTVGEGGGHAFRLGADRLFRCRWARGPGND